MFYNFLRVIAVFIVLWNSKIDAETKEALIRAEKEALIRAEYDFTMQRAVISEKSDRNLKKLLREKGNKQSLLQEVKKIAMEKGIGRVTRASDITTAFYQKQSTILGVKRGDFFRLALFIESGLEDYVKRGQYCIPKEQTLLACSIEYDPNTRSTFILLPENNNTYIGAGKNKVVLKAIYYNEKKAEIVARALQTNIREAEIRTIAKIKGLPGIMDIIACTEYTQGNTQYKTIYSKLYNPGSLSQAFDQGYRFTMYEKMKIVINILKGLNEMHQRNIAHRDISPHNFFINIPPGKPGKRDIDAVVADLGRSGGIWDASSYKGKVQGHSMYTPPDGILADKIKGHDKVLCDVYATGCIFYRLFYDKPSPWLSAKYTDGTAKTQKKRYRGFVNRIQRYTNTRNTALAAKSANGGLTPSEEFEFLILRMCHPDPGKRGTSSQLYNNFQEIFSRYTEQNKE